MGHREIAREVFAMATVLFLIASLPLAADQYSVQDLDFMVGCWRGHIGGATGSEYRETYTFPSSNLILGNSQTIRDGKSVFFEYSRIEGDDTGVALIPAPGGKSSVPFKLVSLNGRRAVFENLEHDFPNRIIYHRRDEESLAARIESKKPGSKGQDFNMKMVPCGNEVALEESEDVAPKPGNFVWHEVASADPVASRRFYTELFGWTSSEVDMGDLGNYTLLKAAGQDVGGIAPLNTAGTGGASQWISYIAVEDVDSATAKAQELGAEVRVPPSDIPDVGRFSLIADPTGAVVALFQPGA